MSTILCWEPIIIVGETNADAILSTCRSGCKIPRYARKQVFRPRVVIVLKSFLRPLDILVSASYLPVVHQSWVRSLGAREAP